MTNLADHARLSRCQLGPQGSARVADHVRRRITAATHHAVCPTAAEEPSPTRATSSSDLPLDVPAAFTAGALIGVATDWLQRGCPRTPAEMAALTRPLLACLHHGDAGTHTSGRQA
jgi:hypothetical protein